MGVLLRGLFVGLIFAAVTLTPSVASVQRAAHRPPTLASSVARRLTRQAREQQATRAGLNTPAARAARIASRTRYAHASAAGALRIASTHFARVVKQPLWRPPTMRGGERLVRYLSDQELLIDEGHGGGRSIVSSTMPLRALTASGSKRPIDLRLRRSGSSFSPAVALARTRFPDSLGAGLELKRTGIRVRLTGASNVAATLAGGKVFYPNAAKDTDFLAAPLPDGFETFLQLRSIRSPQRFALQFRLPRGARLVPGAKRGGAVEIRRRGRLLATVSAPLASDADGRAVKATYRIRDRQLLLQIAHRRADVRYPILVDPTIAENFLYWDVGPDTPSGGSDPYFNVPGAGDYGAWAENHPPGSLYVNTWRGSGGPGIGLNMWTVAGTNYRTWDSGQVIFVPPGQAFVYRAEFGRIKYYNGNPTSYAAYGITNAARTAYEGSYVLWGPDANLASVTSPYQVTCASDCSPNNVPAGSSVVAQLTMAGAGPRPYEALFIGGAYLFMHDFTLPAISDISANPRPTTWTRNTTTHTVTASDNGLGVKSLSVDAPGLNLAHDTPNCAAGANNFYGDRRTGCQSGRQVIFDDAQLPDGVSTVTATAVDLVGDTTPVTRQWTFEMDRVGPSISPSGPAWDHRNQSTDHRNEGLYDSDYALHVDAADGVHSGTDSQRRSGVKSIAVQVDGVQKALVTQPQTCTTVNHHTVCSDTCQPDSCALSADYTLHSDDFTDGDHTINVIATDYAGNPSNSSWTVTVDRQGDIYHAEEFDSDPGSGGVEFGDEVAQINTQNMRREDPTQITTRDVVTCLSDAEGCAQARVRTRNEDSDPSAADSYSTETGTSPDDPRMVHMSDLLAPANSDLGDPVASGPIDDVLAPWQVPPPGHGATYDLYEVTEPATTDGTAGTTTTHLWLDRATKMPLKEAQLEDSTETAPLYYSYDRGRLTAAQVPSDEFSVGRPTVIDGETDYQLPSPVLPPPPADDPTEDELLAASKSFREQFGLRSDDSFVQSVVDDPSLLASQDAFGVPLLPDELSEMQTRLQMQDDLDTIDSYGLQHPDTYAGAYIDQAGGGLVEVGFTQDVDQGVADVKAMFPYPDRVRGFLASHTLTELDSLASEVQSDWDSGELDADNLTSVGIATQANAVIVASSAPSADLASDLAARYGSGVQLDPDPQEVTPAGSRPDNKSLPPLDGGLQIEFDIPNACMTGFTSYSDYHATPSGTPFRLFYELTAGHCLPGVGSHDFGHPWTHNGKFVGRTVQSTLVTSGHTARTDAQDVHIAARNRSTRVFFRLPGDPDNHYRAISSIGHVTHVGEIVCHTSANTGVQRCGAITQYNREVAYNRAGAEWNGSRVQPLTDVSYHGLCGGVKAGDSGGAVYAGGQAVGLVVTFADPKNHCPDGQGDEGDFTDIDLANEALDHHLLHR